MRRKRLRHEVLAGALLIACGVAIAQNAPAPSQSVPATSPAMTQSLPTLVPAPEAPPVAPTTQPNPAPSYGGYGPTYGPSSPPMSAARQPAPDARTLSRSDDPATAFRALDPMNRGYVTRADTDKISGFMGFDSADIDRDGRLTPEEFQNAWRFFAQ